MFAVASGREIFFLSLFFSPYFYSRRINHARRIILKNCATGDKSGGGGGEAIKMRAIPLGIFIVPMELIFGALLSRYETIVCWEFLINAVCSWTSNFEGIGANLASA